MSQVTLDFELRNRLGGLNRATEFFDESGQVLGQFVPAKPYEPNFAEEELQQIEQSEEWYTIDEVLANLREPGTK
jgi:hypothetical protein